VPPDIATASSDLLTIEEAAARIKMSVRYVRRLIADRRLPFHRFGRSVRLRAADLDALADEVRVEPLTATTVWRGMRGVA
jgi:excisionase family DNA binding protein